MATRPTPGTTDWYNIRIQRGQSSSMLRFIEKSGVIPDSPGVDDILKVAIRHGPSITSTDELILLRMLGKGIIADEKIAQVLLHASSYGILHLHRKCPLLLPADQVSRHLGPEVNTLLDLYFDKKRRGDKRLTAFVRKLEKIPGFSEMMAVRHVHDF